MLKLFDDNADRDDSGPKLYGEPEFTYCNRSARREMGRIRQVLEQWFRRYPSEAAPELRQRIRSRDDSNHHAAIFELFLHEILRLLGCQVAVHPESATARSRPDFLVQPKDGDPFYLEAVVVSGESRAQTKIRARIGSLCDDLNKVLRSPDFYVWWNVVGDLKSDPPRQEMVNSLSTWIAGLDRGVIARNSRRNEMHASLSRCFEHDGARLWFHVLPKSETGTDRLGARPLNRPIGERYPMDALLIRDKLIKKAGRYDQLELPLVLAVNVLSWSADGWQDLPRALLGPQADMMAAVGGEKLGYGLWWKGSRSQYGRVAAVMAVTRFEPSSFPRRSICLHHNPWADAPCGPPLTRLPQMVAAKDHVTSVKGLSLADLFELHPEWPEADPPAQAA